MMTILGIFIPRSHFGIIFGLLNLWESISFVFHCIVFCFKSKRLGWANVILWFSWLGQKRWKNLGLFTERVRSISVMWLRSCLVIMCSEDLSTSHHIETEIGGKNVIVQILRLCFITVLISIDEDISPHFENHFSRQNPSIRLVVHCCYH